MSVQYLLFENVDAPLKLDGVPHLLEVIDSVLHGWSYRLVSAPPEVPPFFTLSATRNPDRYNCEDHVGGTEPRRLDKVNAICDLVAALPRALTNSDDSLICLHAAAVAINGRLIVIPNSRRAGKSTLTAALAHAGHAVFSDDVLPLYFDKHRDAFGVAMGVSPRLRVPLPNHFDEDFRQWTKLTSSIENKQYTYLNLKDQPEFGATLPIDGFTILDRREEQAQAQLNEVSADEAMDVLLHQNFTRDRHSADVLHAIASVLSNKPTYRLSFSDLASAVECVEVAFPARLSDAKRTTEKAPIVFRKANLTTGTTLSDFSSIRFRRREGAFEQIIGSTLYLADVDGRAIHRMDALSAAIWDLLAEPILDVELEQVLAEAFPDVPRKQISGDLTHLLGRLIKVGLVERCH